MRKNTWHEEPNPDPDGEPIEVRCGGPSRCPRCAREFVLSPDFHLQFKQVRGRMPDTLEFTLDELVVLRIRDYGEDDCRWECWDSVKQELITDGTKKTMEAAEVAGKSSAIDVLSDLLRTKRKLHQSPR